MLTADHPLGGPAASEVMQRRQCHIKQNKRPYAYKPCQQIHMQYHNDCKALHPSASVMTPAKFKNTEHSFTGQLCHMPITANKIGSCRFFGFTKFRARSSQCASLFAAHPPWIEPPCKICQLLCLRHPSVCQARCLRASFTCFTNNGLYKGCQGVPRWGTPYPRLQGWISRVA